METESNATPKKDLVEVHYVTQFKDPASRRAFLFLCAEIAKGATIYHALDHEHVCVGCETPQIRHEIVELFNRNHELTLTGMQPLAHIDVGCGFILPHLTNPGPRGGRTPMFGKRKRVAICRFLARKYGPYEIWPCEGVWNDGQDLVYDPSDYIRYHPPSRVMGGVDFWDALDLILRRGAGWEWDQQCYYATAEGKAQIRYPKASDGVLGWNVLLRNVRK